MYSMTGYGRADYKENGLELTVEVKTVNNRYLDINSKYPRAFMSFDEAIRSAVQKKLNRGRVDLFINMTDTRERAVSLSLDMPLAKGYFEASKTLKDEFPSLTEDLTVTQLMRLPEVMKQGGETDAEEYKETVLKLVEEALDKLNKMRLQEGEKLKADIASRLAFIEKTLGDIKEFAPLVQQDYRKKIETRMIEILGDAQIDETRLLNEVAFFADKSNIDEEITRLYSHIEQFKKIVKSELVGRKLDFLIQEFFREANTICSKSNNVKLTNSALELKCEIEKIREQIQNLE